MTGPRGSGCILANQSLPTGDPFVVGADELDQPAGT
jgi:hypothetical protein